MPFSPEKVMPLSSNRKVLNPYLCLMEGFDDIFP